MKVAIVAPVHIQPSTKWIRELELIQEQEEADIILVDDSDGKLDLPDMFDVYDYARQKEAMGEFLYNMFQQFHHSAACKQFGLWMAYKLGYDLVIVIDSDCIVPPGFVRSHMVAHEMRGDGWDNPLEGTGWYARGYPYSKRDLPIGAHMGLWTNELDLYGTDRLERTPPQYPDKKYDEGFSFWKSAAPFPQSGMNISFKHEVIPYMLFLPNFTNDKGEFFTRHDDIWGGYIFQKILRAKGYALSYGHPFVYHDTVVVPEEDAAAEVPMITYEDEFYKEVDRILSPAIVAEVSAHGIFQHLGHNFRSDSLYQLRNAFFFNSEAYA